MNATSALFASITVLLNASAQLLLRQAAVTGAIPTSPMTLVRNAWFMLGLVAYGVSVLTWLLVLRRVPLAIAAPIVALVYVLVPLASRTLFNDTINSRMWLGMLFVVLGVSLVAQGAPRASTDRTVKLTANSLRGRRLRAARRPNPWNGGGRPRSLAFGAFRVAFARELVAIVSRTGAMFAMPRKIDGDPAVMTDDSGGSEPSTSGIVDRYDGTGVGSLDIGTNLVGVTDDPDGIVGTPFDFIGTPVGSVG